MDHSFLKAMPVVEQLFNHGYDTYFVGGSVRDYLLGQSIGDIDIATSATPEQVMGIFDKVIPVGIDHGTVLVRWEGESYEVTTFRVDGEYSDYRHPENVKYVSSIEKDLSRRDFTMNAIAMDKNGTLIDPYNGEVDIQLRKIQTVGSPDDRFQEDPLRMMRAIRFVSQHGFELSRETYKAFEQWKHFLDHIAIERIAVEFEKMFRGDHIQVAWNLLITSHLFKHLPLLQHVQFMDDSPDYVKWLPLHDIAEVVTVFHLLDPSIPIDKWVKDWKLSNQVKRKSVALILGWKMWENDKELQTLYHLGRDKIEPFYRVLMILNREPNQTVQELIGKYESLPIHSRQDLHVDGNHIKSWFPEQRPGPWIKNFMERIEALIIIGDMENNCEEIKERVTAWNPHDQN